MPENFQDVVDYNQLHNKTELLLYTDCTDVSLVIECIHVCLVK